MNLATQKAEVEFTMAEVWSRRGKVARAIAGYQKVLDIDPVHQPTLFTVADLLCDRGNPEAAISLYRRALHHNPNHAELHKRYIDLLDLDTAFTNYDLIQQDHKRIQLAPSDLICCVAVRNEALRLPYFLSYYRQQGITHFFIVDNGSTDTTLDYLLEQPDVYVWRSHFSFNQANFGSVWFELLLRKYAIDHWCLIVDADELFYYPDCETKALPQLCQELDQNYYTAYRAILLDLYPKQAVQEAHYQAGQDFLEVCPYFDRQFYHQEQADIATYPGQPIYFGGMRQRVFGSAGNYMLNKIPLLKYRPETVLSGGQHFTNHPAAEIAIAQGCLLHFKYFSSFPDYVRQEVERQEHYADGAQYSEYAQAIATQPNLQLYHSDHSLQFESSQQLIQLGIMQIDRRSHAMLAADRFELASHWLEYGDYLRSAALYQRVLDLQPDYPQAKQKRAEALFQLAFQSMEKGDYSRSQQLYQDVLQLQPDHRQAAVDLEHLQFLAQRQQQQIRSVAPSERKINLTGQRLITQHREGWSFALHAIQPLHHPEGVLFDGFLENAFLWQDLTNQTVPYRQPWVGFLHNPPAMPGVHAETSPQALFAKQTWIESLDACIGLFTLSEYFAEWLRDQTGKPVSALIYPSDIPQQQFSYDRFLQNPDKKIVQLGWWLRRLTSIYQLPIASSNALTYRKVKLNPALGLDSEAQLQKLITFEMEQEQIQLIPDFVQNTQEWDHLSNHHYDQLLSENIAFLHLYDASANTAIVECIARSTPVLVNPLPAVMEYLGQDYPLYFTDLDEAAAKAMDLHLIQAAHNYLKNCEMRQKLSADYFLSSFQASEVYQRIEQVG